jgi:hypothetical protein
MLRRSCHSGHHVVFGQHPTAVRFAAETLEVPHRLLRPIAVALLVAIAVWPRSAFAQSAWYEGFEGLQASWQAGASDVHYRITDHQRARGEAHTGQASESLSLEAGPGSHIYFTHDVGRAQVIDELLVTVWVKASRPGVQLLALVALPRSVDPRTGRRATVLVAGSSYTTAGSWQQLRLGNVPHMVAREARLLRAELGPSIDEREAYVERVVLNVYTGAGASQCWIDDLDVAGFVSRPAEAESRPSPIPLPAAATPVASKPASTRRVELAGPILLVEGRPLFPRAIQYRGEPLELLARLGFNAVWGDTPLTPEFAAEAERVGLWLIGPPPRPQGLDLPYGPVVPTAKLGSERERVIAWDFGRGLGGEHLEGIRRWTEQIRAADPARPLIGQPVNELRAYSRHLDVLLSGREPIGSSLELTSYANWIRGRQTLARPGTPFWTTVQTQLSPGLAEQLRALSGGELPLAVSYEQLRLLIYAALTAGSRGLLFQSYTPLTAVDADTQYRAMALEQINLELALIDPWTAAGNLAGSVTGNVPEVAGAMLRTDRARLLLPMWLGPAAQYVAGQSAANNVTLVVPGVPESVSAYELAPGGLRPLLHKRVVGGMQVTLDEFGVACPVFLAQDPVVIDTVARHMARVGPRMAELQRQLAIRKWQLVSQTQAAIGRRSSPPTQVPQWLDAAGKHLAECNAQFAARQYQASYVMAERSMRALRLVERGTWDNAVRRLSVVVGSAAATSYPTLPWHLQFMEQVSSWRPSPNLLPGGDFEDLGRTLQSGWQHVQHPAPGVQTAAELTAAAAHSGGFGIRLSATADPKSPPSLMELPPVWLASPPVSVQAGCWVCIRGWVNVPGVLSTGVDGLWIIDSLGGEALAARIGHTVGWQEFLYYRYVPDTRPVSVTFALAALGQVMIDDVTIQVLER